MGAYIDCAKSKTLTATGQVSTAGKASVLYSVNVYGSGTTAVVTLSNGNGGDTILQVGQAAGNESVSYTLNKGIVFSNDIYATVGGAGPIVTIEYDEIE